MALTLEMMALSIQQVTGTPAREMLSALQGTPCYQIDPAMDRAFLRDKNCVDPDSMQCDLVATECAMLEAASLPKGKVLFRLPHEQIIIRNKLDGMDLAFVVTEAGEPHRFLIDHCMCSGDHHGQVRYFDLAMDFTAYVGQHDVTGNDTIRYEVKVRSLRDKPNFAASEDFILSMASQVGLLIACLSIPGVEVEPKLKGSKAAMNKRRKKHKRRDNPLVIRIPSSFSRGSGDGSRKTPRMHIRRGFVWGKNTRPIEEQRWHAPTVVNADTGEELKISSRVMKAPNSIH